MSEIKTAEEKAAAARRGPASQARGGNPHMRIGQPTERSRSLSLIHI